MNAFGNRLKQLRNETGLTGDEFGKLFNVTKSAISNWEIRNRFPDEDVLKKLADYFDVSLDYLMGRSDLRRIESSEDIKKKKVLILDLIKTLVSEGIIKDENNISIETLELLVKTIEILGRESS